MHQRTTRVNHWDVNRDFESHMLAMNKNEAVGGGEEEEEKEDKYEKKRK